MANRTLTGQVEFDVTAVSETEAQGEMQIGPGMLNPVGTVHAGALIWFADVVATNLVMGGEQVTEGMDSFPVAITLNAQLLANQKQGSLAARAVWLRRGRRVSTVRTQVTDESGKVLLDLTSTHLGTHR
ncbi:PaaI family thioesterase [Paracoccus sp. R12_1]|jgi:1,4-dihydroxy-2-naphthoyl-CoA hydrolase|uniref:PaaI family thioesterase n=1 Tax=unclassified Paracoccus (in: a-proteobacteria) TaxID=2688777 RepID=UPI001ADA89BA|nr:MULTISPECIES: PaaI family thioesterase [unclassified Paracoccus (in: a-proteobacteria)]MBO9454580.1 PaaI family thioesterase [Paracoccus sp. R12_2]MBO9486134.1 PaaI family thioesterase [Paracoccus sp. R12_1]